MVQGFKLKGLGFSGGFKQRFGVSGLRAWDLGFRVEGLGHWI